jgi:hypothetical protein
MSPRPSHLHLLFLSLQGSLETQPVTLSVDDLALIKRGMYKSA